MDYAFFIFIKDLLPFCKIKSLSETNFTSKSKLQTSPLILIAFCSINLRALLLESTSWVFNSKSTSEILSSSKQISLLRGDAELAPTYSEFYSNVLYIFQDFKKVLQEYKS